MSRVGKKPIEIPTGVTVTLNNSTVTVKGPKGELTRSFSPDMEINVEENLVTITRPSDIKGRWVLK
jgi:large subunit ribosomal protein L6